MYGDARCSDSDLPEAYGETMSFRCDGLTHSIRADTVFWTVQTTGSERLVTGVFTKIAANYLSARSTHD